MHARGAARPTRVAAGRVINSIYEAANFTHEVIMRHEHDGRGFHTVRIIQTQEKDPGVPSMLRFLVRHVLVTYTSMHYTCLMSLVCDPPPLLRIPLFLRNTRLTPRIREKGTVK